MSAVDGIDEFAAKLAGILKEKNAAYGDSLAKVPTMLSFIFPEIPVEKLTLICAFSRALEKFGRMASNPTAFGEDPWMDVAGGFLVHANIDRLKREAKVATVKNPNADVPRTGVMFVGDEAVHYDMPVDVPSEPNGRIKRDAWPFVVIHTGATGWYLKHTGRGDRLFNVYCGGCWHLDERDATAFPSYEAAFAYLRRQGLLNAAPPGEASSCE